MPVVTAKRYLCKGNEKERGKARPRKRHEGNQNGKGKWRVGK
jgi:hypothetical protein